jgi:arsenate reductase
MDGRGVRATSVVVSQHEEDAMDRKPKVLFICVHNSARSQMAEEFLRTLAGDRFDVESAGLEPGEVHPLTIEVMREEGVDLSRKSTNDAFEFFKSGKRYDFVIIVCDKETEAKCPTYPGTRHRLYWPFEDPSKATGSREEQLQTFREIRNQIKRKVGSFVEVMS